MADELTFVLKLKDEMSKSAKEASKALKEAKGSLKELGEASEQGVTSLSKVASVLGPVGTGFAAVGAAALAVTGVVAGLTYEALKFGSEVTSARERTIALFDALGEGPEAGKRTLAMLDDLSGKLPQSRDQLSDWAKQLEAMGITDLGEVRSQLQAVASAQAIVGKEGAEHYLTLRRRIQEAVDTHSHLKIADKQLAQLGLTGANVNNVAAEMGISAKKLRDQLKSGQVDAKAFGDAMETALLKKGKGPLATLGSDLPTVLAKGKEAFAKLFDSIDFKPLVDGLRQFFGAFSESEPAGATLKHGITTGLNAVVRMLGHVLTEATIFFLTVELRFLQARNFIRPYVKMWNDVADGIDRALKPLKTLLDYQEKAMGFLPKLLGGAIGKLATGGENVSIAQPLSPEQWAAKQNEGAQASIATPHARGGLVRPARGELFASVAPGEMILPHHMSQMFQRGGALAGGYVSATMGPSPFASRQAAGGGGGSRVSIEHVSVTVHAAGGMTDANEITAHALARALERYQLAVGR